jgi:membrane-associated protease RseP (regulator of RpoE activity)
MHCEASARVPNCASKAANRESVERLRRQPNRTWQYSPRVTGARTADRLRCDCMRSKRNTPVWLGVLLELLLCGCGARGDRDEAEPVSVGPQRPAAAEPVVTEPSTKATAEACPSDARGAVRSSDERHCELDRDVWFGEHDCLIATPSITQVSAGGRAIGFRNDSIGRNSVLSLCGIRPGDIWTKVNGGSVATADDVLELYPKLRHADKLTIDLLRDGESVAVEIALR